MTNNSDSTKDQQRIEELYNEVIVDFGISEGDHLDHYRRVYKKMAEIRKNGGKAMPNEWALDVPEHMYETVLKYFRLLLPESQFLIGQSFVYKEQKGEKYDLFENFNYCYERFLKGDLITKYINGPELIALLQDSNLLENIMGETWIIGSLMARNKEKIDKYIIY
jgi:hypothetical protein